jgi:UDP-N-acetylmuramoylalanine--D-glutamate ligase
MTRDLTKTRAGVVGLGKSGVAAARLLAAKGARVVAVDRRPAEELGEPVAALASLGVRLAVGAPRADVYRDCDLLVVSPGVPLVLPEIEGAERAGVEVVGEVELASWFLPEGSVLLGITGTNGKSTTTALVGCLCETAGFATFTGGNLGRPLSEAPLEGEPFRYVVCELSSFQLEGIRRLRPRVAVVTNLTADHVDRYPSHAAYGHAKRRIFMNQTPDDFAIVNRKEHGGTVSLAAEVESQVHSFGFGSYGSARAIEQEICVSLGKGEERYRVRSRVLRGAHNVENAMAAILLARLGGVPADRIQAGLDAFPGLAHRIELAGVVLGVEYVNDSKATNVDSTVVGLNAFSAGVWLIAGGRGKGASYTPMADASRGRVKGVLTIGEDAQAIASAYQGVVEVIPCGDLGSAVRESAARARAGDVVLLSPACASYDQFKNFEDRGEQFKALVKALSGGAA